jgi:hypothetical protein
MLAVMLAFYLPSLWALDIQPSSAMAAVLIAGFIFYLLLATAFQVSVLDNCVNTLRGRAASLIPAGIVRRTLATLLAELKIFLAVAVPAMLAALASGFISMSLFASETEGLEHPILAGLVSGLILFMVVGWLAVRWGAGIAAAAVGEKVSFRESWRMTRGHSLSMLVSLLPMAVLPQLGSLLMDGESLMNRGFSLAMLTTMALSAVAYLFSYALLSVWYVRLRERYQLELAAAPAAASGPADE